MKTRNPRMLLMAAAIALATPAIAIPSSPLQGPTSHNQVECASDATQIKTVTAPDFHDATVIFNAPPDGTGHFHPTPLISTTVKVGGGRRPSCLAVNFSAVARPIDNGVVFQARVDGVPMEGNLSSLAGINTPAVIFQTTSLDQFANVRQFMVSYNFWKEVQPGIHTVEVLFAGCCSALEPPPGTITAQVGSPTLVIHHR